MVFEAKKRLTLATQLEGPLPASRLHCQICYKDRIYNNDQVISPIVSQDVGLRPFSHPVKAHMQSGLLTSYYFWRGLYTDCSICLPINTSICNLSVSIKLQQFPYTVNTPASSTCTPSVPRKHVVIAIGRHERCCCAAMVTDLHLMRARLRLCGNVAGIPWDVL